MIKVDTPKWLKGQTQRLFNHLVGDAMGLHVRDLPPTVKVMHTFNVEEYREVRRVQGITVEGGFSDVVVYNHGPDAVTLMIDPPFQTSVVEPTFENGLTYPGRNYEFQMFFPPTLAQLRLEAGGAFDRRIFGETLYIYKDDEPNEAKVDLVLLGYGLVEYSARTLQTMGLK